MQRPGPPHDAGHPTPRHAARGSPDRADAARRSLSSSFSLPQLCSRSRPRSRSRSCFSPPPPRSRRTGGAPPSRDRWRHGWRHRAPGMGLPRVPGRRRPTGRTQTPGSRSTPKANAPEAQGAPKPAAARPQPNTPLAPPGTIGAWMPHRAPDTGLPPVPGRRRPAGRTQAPGSRSTSKANELEAQGAPSQRPPGRNPIPPPLPTVGAWIPHRAPDTGLPRVPGRRRPTGRTQAPGSRSTSKANELEAQGAPKPAAARPQPGNAARPRLSACARSPHPAPRHHPGRTPDPARPCAAVRSRAARAMPAAAGSGSR